MVPNGKALSIYPEPVYPQLIRKTTLYRKLAGDRCGRNGRIRCGRNGRIRRWCLCSPRSHRPPRSVRMAMIIRKKLIRERICSIPKYMSKLSLLFLKKKYTFTWINLEVTSLTKW